MARIEKRVLTSEADGLGLALVVVEPEGEPVALIQLAHGMTEHKGRYLPFMEFLAEQGFACVMNDHRGHGESVRDKGDLGYFYEGGAEALVRDMHQVSGWFRARHPGKRLLLFGHSMGSLAARVYMQHWDGDIDGVVLCGVPGKNGLVGVGLVLLRVMAAIMGQRHVSGLLKRMLTGMFKKGLPREEASDSAWLSTDREVVLSYDEDPLCGFGFTLNGYIALFELMRDAHRVEPAKNPGLPVHFVSGEDDPVAPDAEGFEASVDVVRQSGYTRVTAKRYPGMRHELITHRNHRQVYEDLAEVFSSMAGRGK